MSSIPKPLAPTGTDQQAPATTTAAATITTTTTEAAVLDTQDASGRLPAAAAAGAAELARAKLELQRSLKVFPDFPIPGINFIDILPLFQRPATHNTLLRALELQVHQQFGAGAALAARPDVVVGLEARGFLFGPALALRLGASFVPVRKQGKMPGPCVTAAYEKEYGLDHFQMQEGAIAPGQKVLVVDDIVATGGSAAAAASLVTQLGGTMLGYLFVLEIPFLKGRDKLGGLPTITLLDWNVETTACTT
ncbi:hypothetical protein P8C59_008085 [Phyllachora maydis]|uniref:adenine phosphoribosyltransferase n=1 Tax=Phyllachora maydis TaxID=1825666 RepID=A0AAD9I9W2_9PEZI|nr:hypothetical protein P8C59_008085 [Phyllachora maydis]